MDSYWEVVEPLFSVIQFDRPEAFFNSITPLPRSSVLLFAAHMCLAEVYNGGFLQLFWNNTGLIVPEGIEGFLSIGMPGMAGLLREAARPLGEPYPRDRDERWDAMLAASALSESQLQQIFEKHKQNPDEVKGLYSAFVEATLGLKFDEIDKRFWETARVENGGFQDAATSYANKFA